MGDEKDLLERISRMEVQVKDISEVKEKLDSLYDLIVDMKIENANVKGEFATKQECAELSRELHKRMDKIEEGKRKVMWASITSGIAFTFWLMEQLLHLSIKIGG